MSYSLMMNLFKNMVSISRFSDSNQTYFNLDLINLLYVGDLTY